MMWEQNNRRRPTFLLGPEIGALRPQVSVSLTSLCRILTLHVGAGIGGLCTRHVTILHKGSGLHLLSTFHVPGIIATIRHDL